MERHPITHKCGTRLWLCCVQRIWTDSAIRTQAGQRYAWLMKRHLMNHKPDTHKYLMREFGTYRAITEVPAPHERLPK